MAINAPIAVAPHQPQRERDLHLGCIPCRYFPLDARHDEQRTFLAVGRVCGAGVLYHALRGPVDRLGEAKRERNPRSVLVLLDWWGADIVHLCPPPPRSRLRPRRGGRNLHLLSKPLLNLAQAPSSRPSRCIAARG